MSFIHLKARSHYSLQDGLGSIDGWVQRAAEFGFGAMAITECDNLFSAIKFYRKAIAQGIKPIIGVDIQVASPPGYESTSRLVLLCMHMEGLRNLNRMLTAAWQQSQPPVVARNTLEQYSDGLIALSGLDGELAQLYAMGAGDKAMELLPWWQGLFPGNFCLAVQRTGLPGEETWISNATALAVASSVPLVAVNDCRFINRENYEAHEARVCILSGDTLDNSNRQRLHSDGQYLRSADEMKELFADIPVALENSLAIAKRCNVEIEFDVPQMPHFPDDGGAGQDALLRKQAQQQLDAFLERNQGLQAELYQQRLERELAVIVAAGYAGYFLIVADFIHWAREQGIPVGPGRGSGGGSLVAFVTSITRIDPIAHDLLFERFLNPERVSLPDFDVDFCMQRRDEVISYVGRRYGRDRVAQIITYGAMNAKAAVRDVVRIMGLPYMLGDRLAKQVPPDLDMTLDKALKDVATLRGEYNKDEQVRSVIDLARQLEGSVRHPGRHAGGIVITPQPLVHYMPMYSDGESEGLLTQFDMNDIEAIGLVKFDFLGLKTLTVIDRCLRHINDQRKQAGQTALDMEQVPMNDHNVYERLQKGETMAVFQLESFAMKRLVRDLKPSCFDDLVALVALMRPGPLESGMTDSYIARKRNNEKVDPLHQIIEPILRPTYGVVLYQEQVMEIAQTMSGYTLGMADLLRRAMGKKKPEEMKQHEVGFVDGAVANNIKRTIAKKIFSQIEKFAGYGFNKSHSVAYALISYYTAWLKSNHTATYMASVLSTEQDNVERMEELCRELPELGVELVPPDVNASVGEFLPAQKSMLYSLGAIRGVGRGVVECIVAERGRSGPFTSLQDLCCRLDPTKCSRRVLEALVQAGALDGFGNDRATLFDNIPVAMAFATQVAANKEDGSEDMFGLGGDTARELPLQAVKEHWNEYQTLEREWQVLGQYLSGHPVAVLRREIRQLKLDSLTGEIKDNDHISFVALVRGYFWGKGRRYLDILVEDEHKRAKLRFNSSAAAAFNIPKERELVYIEATANNRGNVIQDELMLRSVSVWDLAYMYDSRAMLLLVLHSQDEDINGKSAAWLLQQLRNTMAAHPGGSLVRIKWQRGELDALLAAGTSWRVRISSGLLQDLRSLLGADKVQLRYHRNSVQPSTSTGQASDAAPATAA